MPKIRLAFGKKKETIESINSKSSAPVGSAGRPSLKNNLRLPPPPRIDTKEHQPPNFQRSGVFRFFDLPPELPNHVYSELLTFTERDGKSNIGREETHSHPVILRTCR